MAAKNPTKGVNQVGETPPNVTHESPPVPDWLGSMKGSFEILGDIVSPASEESDWEVLRD